MIQVIKKYYKKKKTWFYRNIYRRMSPQMFHRFPKLMASMWYAINMGELPNLYRPKNVNELWMSLNLRAMKDPVGRHLRILCADKYAVREYLKQKGFGDILNECYGVYDSFDEIDFDSLPNQFVLKMTTGSGMNFICRDKNQLDKNLLRKKVNEWLVKCKDFGLKTAEWHYVEIKPRLIIEKYLSQLGESSLVDYKWHCFNGQIYHIEIIYDRDERTDLNTCDTYDIHWNRTDCVMPQYRLNRRLMPKPKTFSYMKQIAEVLSSDFEYVRVDLYEVDGTVLFGELTFTPVGCIEHDYYKQYLEDMCRFYYATKRK